MSLNRRWRLPFLILILLALLIGAAAVQTGRHGPEWEWYDRGIDAGARGNVVAAEENFERAVRVNPRFQQGYDWIVQSCIVLRRPDRALNALHQLSTLNPNYPHLAALYTETYAGVDNVSMLRWARAAVLQEPRSPRARILFALGLSRSDNGRDALVELAAAERLFPSALLARSLKEDKALAANPKELARRLAPLVPQIPLE